MDTISRAVIFLSSGLAIFFLGFIFKQIKKSRLKKREPAVGEVIDIKERDNRVKAYKFKEYTPVVKFEANNGVVTGDDGLYFLDKELPYKVGDKVNIRYNPINNNQFYLVHEMHKKQIDPRAASLMFAGIMLIALGIMVLLGIM